MSNRDDVTVGIGADTGRYDRAMRQVKNTMGTLPGSAKRAAGGVSGAFRGARDAASRSFSGITSAAKTQFNAVVRHASGAMRQVKSIVGGTFRGLGKLMKISGMAAGLGAIIGIVGGFENITAALQAADERAKASGSTAATLAEKWAGVQAVFGRIGANLADRLLPLFHVIFDQIILPNLPMVEHLFARLGEIVTGTLVPTFERWAPVIQQVINSGLMVMYVLLSDLTPLEKLNAIFYQIGEVMAAVFGPDARRMVYDLFFAIDDIITRGDWSAMFGLITGALKAAWEGVLTWWDATLWPLVKEKFGFVLDWWDKNGGTVTASIKKVFEDFGTWWTDTGWPAIDGAIKTAWKALTDWWNTTGGPLLKTAFEDAFKALSAWWDLYGPFYFEKIGQNIADFIANGLTSSGNALLGWLDAQLAEFLFKLGGGQGRVPTGTGMFGVLPAPERAMGGPVMPGRPYTVGERGIETFVPSQPGRIVNNYNTNNWNLTQHGLDRQTMGASAYSFGLLKSLAGD